MRYLVVATALLLGALAGSAQADAIYISGNECPADPLTTPYTRQYYVTPASACVFDPASNNIQGTDAEAALYLDGGPAIWGDGWDGLGEAPAGFAFTADAGNDDGTFTISDALAAVYDQFAIGIKDGSLPFWAIFLLPPGTQAGSWGLSTEGGDLSHFAVYGHDTGPGTPPPPPPPPPPPIPEPANLTLLGLGLAMVGWKFRR